MAQPTIESRRRRRLLLMSASTHAALALKARVPSGWEVVETLDLDSIGDLAEVLQLRLALIDLDESDVFDPVDAIKCIRAELMVNVPIFGFSGTPTDRDAARMAGADRLLALMSSPFACPSCAINSVGNDASRVRQSFGLMMPSRR